MGNQNNDTVVNQLTKRINGIAKYMKAEKAEIAVNGELVKPARLQAMYQSSLDARQAVAAGHATYLAAIKDRDEGEAVRLAADESLKAFVLGRYGAGSTEANEFGFAPRKKADVPVATRARAVVLNKATRDARGTVGRKKKADANPRAPVDDFVELRVVA